MGGAATYGPGGPSAAFWGLQMATGQTSGSTLWSIWFAFTCGSKPSQKTGIGRKQGELFLTQSCWRALMKFSSRCSLYSWTPQRLLAGGSPRPVRVGESGLGFSRCQVEQSYPSSFGFSLSCRGKAKQGLVRAGSGTNILLEKSR